MAARPGGHAASLREALQAWRAALGDAAVDDREETLARYAQCTTGARRSVLAVLRPRTTKEVVRLVREAGRFRLPLHPVSTGHNWGYGTALAAAAEAVVVDLSGMRAIRELDAELGVVTVEPGVTQGELAAFLRERGAPFLVPVTGAGPSCSLVGNALERGYGITPLADHAAAVMGLEAVLHDGTVLRPVLAELGAEDAARLFPWGIGAYVNGLFFQAGHGIVTSMTLALARRPEAVRAFVMSAREGATPSELVAAVREVLRALPGIVGGINLMNAHRVLAMSAPYPVAHLGPDGLIPREHLEAMKRERDVGEWTLFGTLYGSAGVVRAAQARIARLLKPLARRLLFVSRSRAHLLARVAARLPARLAGRLAPAAQTLAAALALVDGEPNETALPLAYWRAGIRPPAKGGLDPARDGCGLIWYAPLVPMRPAAVEAYLRFVTATMRRHGIEPLVTLTSLSERCFDSSVPLLFDRGSAAATERAQACYRCLLEEGRALGFVPYRFGVDAMDWLTGQPAVHWELVARLKQALDPQGILSPGRYARVPPG